MLKKNSTMQKYRQKGFSWIAAPQDFLHPLERTTFPVSMIDREVPLW